MTKEDWRAIAVTLAVVHVASSVVAMFIDGYKPSVWWILILSGLIGYSFGKAIELDD